MHFQCVSAEHHVRKVISRVGCQWWDCECWCDVADLTCPSHHVVITIFFAFKVPDMIIGAVWQESDASETRSSREVTLMVTEMKCVEFVYSKFRNMEKKITVFPFDYGWRRQRRWMDRSPVYHSGDFRSVCIGTPAVHPVNVSS